MSLLWPFSWWKNKYIFTLKSTKHTRAHILYPSIGSNFIPCIQHQHDKETLKRNLHQWINEEREQIFFCHSARVKTNFNRLVFYGGWECWRPNNNAVAHSRRKDWRWKWMVSWGDNIWFNAINFESVFPCLWLSWNRFFALHIHIVMWCEWRE